MFRICISETLPFKSKDGFLLHLLSPLYQFKCYLRSSPGKIFFGGREGGMFLSSNHHFWAPLIRTGAVSLCRGWASAPIPLVAGGCSPGVHSRPGGPYGAAPSPGALGSRGLLEWLCRKNKAEIGTKRAWMFPASTLPPARGCAPSAWLIAFVLLSGKKTQFSLLTVCRGWGPRSSWRMAGRAQHLPPSPSSKPVPVLHHPACMIRAVCACWEPSQGAPQAGSRARWAPKSTALIKLLINFLLIEVHS